MRSRSAFGKQGGADFCDDGPVEIPIATDEDGWLVASGPDELKRKAAGKVGGDADTYLSPNAPVQLATPVFLEATRRISEASHVAREEEPGRDRSATRAAKNLQPTPIRRRLVRDIARADE